MITSTYNYGYSSQVLPIMNYNIISDNKKKEAIKAMGMSACQAGWMSRGCCSKCHGGGHH
jgi:hypothetical protein